MDNSTVESGKAFLDNSRFWIQLVLTPIVALVGITGNFITVIVLTRRRMSSSTNTYLTALAIVDLFYLMFIYYLSHENKTEIMTDEFRWYWQLRPYAVWAADILSGVSIWLTVSFTIERYIAVCHPLRGKVFCTESRARKVIAIIIVICTFSTITTPFEWKMYYGINSDGDTCVRNEFSDFGKNDTYRLVYYWFCATSFILVPIVVIAIFNSFLVNAVRQSRKQRIGLTQQMETSAGCNNRQKQENKITMTLIAVVMLFLVCQTPTAVLLILYIIYNPPEHTSANYIFLGCGNIFNFLAALNAACNFLLYCVMSDKYRRTLILTFLPCLANRHQRSLTFTSYNASHNNTSVRFNQPKS